MENGNRSRHGFMPTDDIPFSFLNEGTYIQLLSIWRRIRRHSMIFTGQNMEDELLRLVTFLHFPQQTGQDIRVLAIAGFYYYGEGDSVVCYCCGLWVRSWSQNDEPWYIHRTCSTTCTFIQNNRVVNRPYYGITEGGFRHLEDVIQLLPGDTIGPLPVRSGYEIQSDIMFTTEQNYQTLEHIEHSRLLPSAALPMRNGEVQNPYLVNGASQLQENSFENFDIEARIVSIRNSSSSRASASYFNRHNISERNIPLRIDWSEDGVSDSMLNENLAPQSHIMSTLTENHSENHICTTLSTDRGRPIEISNLNTEDESVQLDPSSNSANMSEQIYVCEVACDDTARKQLADVNSTTNVSPRTFFRSMSTPLPAEYIHQSPNHMCTTRVERPDECQNTAKVNIVACESQSGQGSPSCNDNYTVDDVENDTTTPRHISNINRLEETETEETNNYLSLSDRNDSTNSDDDNKSQEHAGMSEEISSNRLSETRTNYKGNEPNIISSNEETTITRHRSLQDTSHRSCSINDKDAEVTVPFTNNHKTHCSPPGIIGVQENAIEPSVDTLSLANTTPDVEACDAQSNATRDVEAEKPLRHDHENERETKEELNATAESMTGALATESKLSSDVNTSAVHTADAPVVSVEKKIPVKEHKTSQNHRNKASKVTSKPDDNCSNDHGEAPSSPEKFSLVRRGQIKSLNKFSVSHHNTSNDKGAEKLSTYPLALNQSTKGAVDVSVKTNKVENNSTVQENTSRIADTFTDDINKGAVDVSVKTNKVENNSTVQENTSRIADTFTDDINKGKCSIDSIDLRVRKQTESAQGELSTLNIESTTRVKLFI